MILVGQYDFPYARRVAVSLRVLGFEYEHDRRSVFGDFDSMLQTNPVGRVPCLVLDDGEVLIESGAILDWLDQTVGSERALVPPAGLERRRALKLIAVAAGATDKAAASSHERIVRPVALRWPEWIARCRRQVAGGLAVLEAEAWPADAPLDQVQITTACLIRYVQMTDPELLPRGRYPGLEKLSEHCEARPEFRATWPSEAVLPKGE